MTRLLGGQTIRPLSQFEAAARGASTMAPQASKALKAGIKGFSQAGEADAPAFEVSNVFSYQSYFDSTLLETAILRQPPNETIVPSTRSKPIQVGGYAIGLLPSSETPVAITLDTGAQQGASPTYHLKPGEMLRPHGRPKGIGHPGQFSGFRWGLPFGWLGGGSATLIVFRTADAVVNWQDHNEVAFHRIRLPIFDPTLLPATPNPNWPERFPWPYAQFGAASLTQRGQPNLALHPTRTLMRLTLAAPGTLAAPSTMRVFFRGADVLAAIPNASFTGTTLDDTDVAFTDYTWGSYTALAGAPAPYSVASETDILTGQLERIACNGGLTASSTITGAVVLGAIDAALIGSFCDFVRYGRL